jgi:hypothetical protein
MYVSHSFSWFISKATRVKEIRRVIACLFRSPEEGLSNIKVFCAGKYTASDAQLAAETNSSLHVLWSLELSGIKENRNDWNLSRKILKNNILQKSIQRFWNFHMRGDGRWLDGAI